uniref:RING-type domain-containing protein n=1 Tax=viral metagenome TaxID=1070528 RepID=A0A6C0AC53_9ZZZZ
MDCIICLNSIENFYVPEFIKCEHYCFHKHCLKKWLEKSYSCPICRKEYDREPTIIQEKIKQENNIPKLTFNHSSREMIWDFNEFRIGDGSFNHPIKEL